MEQFPCIFVVGPSAVGKSEVALHLAERLSGEIISLDSMQVYRGMDIGTAKPTRAERSRVHHHLIDVVAVTQPFDAAQFVALAKEAVVEIRRRGKTPVFCGGTGLYAKAYLEGLGDAPRADTTIREELERMPLVELLEELKRSDPQSYASIDKKNPRRVVRALEVMRVTGKPYSALRATWKSPRQESSERKENRATGQIFGLTRPSPDLRGRIERRVQEMFRLGLVEETRSLLSQGMKENRTAMQAIGYRQVVDWLQGKGSLEETEELVIRKTKQLAKRQMTWFRRQMSVEWIEVTSDESAEAVASRVWKRMDKFRTSGDK